MKRNRYFLILLAFLFLLTQQGAVLHVLTHVPEEIQQSQQKSQFPTHADACELCFAYAAIGSGLLPAALSIAASDVLTTYVVKAPPSLFSQPLLAYRSRAPPFLV